MTKRKFKRGQKVKLKYDRTQVGRVISGPPVSIGKKDDLNIFPIEIKDSIIVNWQNGMTTIEKISDIIIVKRRKTN